MLGEKHYLVNELPEYRERIRELKATDPHFADLYEQYHEVEHEVRLSEARNEGHSDAYMEDLKKRRLLLKDQLYEMLRADD
ncbi:MAG: YdcH family protein [Gammaproteobacteria bacterium]